MTKRDGSIFKPNIFRIFTSCDFLVHDFALVLLSIEAGLKSFVSRWQALSKNRSDDK